jgi:hypothetical protein
MGGLLLLGAIEHVTDLPKRSNVQIVADDRDERIAV